MNPRKINYCSRKIEMSLMCNTSLISSFREQEYITETDKTTSNGEMFCFTKIWFLQSKMTSLKLQIDIN